MQEVDNIVIHTLRQMGCDLPSDVDSLRSFTPSTVVEATSMCLSIINSSKYAFPKSLPHEMSKRFRLCSDLAGAVKDLGWKGDLGYNQFLYPNESEIRFLLMWLVERLPSDDHKHSSTALGTTELLHRKITGEFVRRLGAGWSPSFCKKDGLAWKMRAGPTTIGKKGKKASLKPAKPIIAAKPDVLAFEWQFESCRGIYPIATVPLDVPHLAGDVTSSMQKEAYEYSMTRMPYVTAQPAHRQDIAPSILEKNSSSFVLQADWEQEWNEHGLGSGLNECEYRNQKTIEILSRISDVVRPRIRCERGDGDMKVTQSSLDSLIASFSSSSARDSKGSRFTHTAELQFGSESNNSNTGETHQLVNGLQNITDTEEEKRKQRELELTEMEANLNALVDSLERLESESNELSETVNQTESQLQHERSETEEKENAYKIKKRTADLLPETDTNVEKLQELIESSSARLADLESQWEAHRDPLVNRISELKHEKQMRIGKSRHQLEQIKEYRESMKRSTEDIRTKDELIKQLTEEYERMPKDINRAMYTKRILEIVRNIKKQKVDIDKVLIDTRSLQRDINSISDVLARTFTSTDELIFFNAKKDEASKKSYKLLAALHTGCTSLVKGVEDTSAILNEIRSLEDKLEDMRDKKIEENLQSITNDLEQMRKENHSSLEQ